jgi:hypothetical protein
VNRQRIPRNLVETSDSRRSRELANQDDQSIQLVIPLKEGVDLVQRGLINLASAAFTQVAEQATQFEVTALVGPKNQPDSQNEATCAGGARRATA